MAPKDKKPGSVPPSAPPSAPPSGTPEGERIAKVLSRRGVASRREAERLIEAGEVTVNGKIITSPALNVTPRDRITISGHPLPEEEPARLWLYYKPEGLVTSTADEKGRDTVFDHLPPEMPRVMSIGRLDLNSEGLLLLTNDGELKRRLELPSTGWLRKYRVRINGNPTDAQLDPLRKGITVEGERFQPMQVTLDRIQGANAWLTVGLREGKNREIRRALNAIDLYVNRLIRTSYGPFRLNDLKPGEVEEIRPRVLREQLGEAAEVEAEVDAPRPRPGRPAARSTTKPAGKLAGKLANRPMVKHSGSSATRRAAPRAEGETAPPRPARPGAGVKALSRAWAEAVTPDPSPRGAPPARKPSTTKPSTRKPATRNAPQPKPPGKPPKGRPPR